jgi:hypothetical protein
MKARRRPRRAFACAALPVAALCLLALAGCDQPKVRPPAAPVASSAPLPPLPDWSRPLIGKPLAALYPPPADGCIGNADVVERTYLGEPAGAKVVGWGWETAAAAPVTRVLLADAAGRVAGAGETGLSRPDVVAARPQVTSPATGWAAYVRRTDGPVLAYGVVAGGKALCRLGALKL